MFQAKFLSHFLFSNFFLPLPQDYSISEWLNKGASKEKLVVGFPTYGRSFTLASPNLTDVNAPAIKGGNAGKFTKETGFLAFFEVYELSSLFRRFKVYNFLLFLLLNLFSALRSVIY